MSNTDGRNALDPDAPLKALEDDRLGYSDYAAYLARVLSSQLPSDGYVVGINGQWGVGKSMMLNFVEQHLESTDNPPIIVQFHPWMFSGRADLTSKFLEELGESLENEDEQRFKRIKSKIESLASSLSGIPISSTTGIPAEQVAGLLAQLLSDEDEQPVGKIKENISDRLSGSDRQIIVMLDDIDRLSPREITQVFQLIKSVADFPNTTYLLSFDRKIVVKSIEEEMNIDSGENYLEKIVQLPLVIPNHSEGSLISIFLSQLDEFEMDGELQYEQSRLDDLVRNSIEPLINTPRDAIRLANTIAVTSGPIRREVDFVDFIGLELLRSNCYEVYEAIRQSGERFVGRISYRQRRNGEWDDYSDLLGLVPEEDQEAVESVLRLLFVQVNDNLSRSTSQRDWGELQAEMRICHPRRYPVYFESAIPDGEISSVRMGMIMSVIDSPDNFTEELRALSHEAGFEGGGQKRILLFAGSEIRWTQSGQTI
ncbi:hypothetical protein BRC86_13650 [Halobacteriales archaeon QS_3_64_16]|nr:MAG: hypothetical protein BRC86_13650 [Halobacteriales archaeon QS_3_64_16]